jgi:hypothetical protein
MARRGIHGLVVVRTTAQHSVCHQHRRWLYGSDQLDLERLPEIFQANRRHRRLARNLHAIPAALDHREGQRIVRDWFLTADQPELQQRWIRRLGLLPEDPYGDPNRPSLERIELVTYPETVIVTGLIASGHWHADSAPGSIT